MTPRYKDNPNHKAQVVTTVSGIKEYRVNCRFIKGVYYAKEVDIFNINDKWYKKDGGFIAYDYELKQWRLKNAARMVQGVVEFDGGKPVIGMFTPNIYNNVVMVSDIYGKRTALNSEILQDAGYFENVSTSTWYNRKEVGEAKFRNYSTPQIGKGYGNKGYNIEENVDEFAQKKQTFLEYPIKLTKDVRRYARFLGDLTFGMELECSVGTLPDNIQHRLGIVACKDGSLTYKDNYNSPEFVTVPMQGARGLQNVANISNELKKRCNIDINCSFHIHIGNIPTDRAYIVALYILCYRIQDELLKMFPYYKTEPGGIKQKNYCQKLRKMNIHPLVNCSKESYREYIDEIYQRIFTFLSDGMMPGEQVNRKQQRHPIDQKYNRKSRYYGYNLQNMLFSPRKTMEARMHPGTMNSQKMINWLFFQVAIVKFAQNNTKDIITGKKDINLKKVLDHFKDNFTGERAAFLSEYLWAYYQERRDTFAKDYKKGDYVSDHDLVNDKTYEFTYGNHTHLF